MGTHTVVAPNSVLRGYGRMPRKGGIEHEARKSQSELGKGIRVTSSKQRAQQMQNAHQMPLLCSLLSNGFPLYVIPSIPTMVVRVQIWSGPNSSSTICPFLPPALWTLWLPYCHKICQAHSRIQAFILAVSSIWDSLSPNILQAHFIQRSLFGDTFPAPSPI